MPFITSIRVRGAETDLTGIVHHSSYLLYYEEARTEAMREIGLLYEELDQHGLFTAAIAAGQKYKAPAFYDDLLTISTWLRKVNAYIAKF